MVIELSGVQFGLKSKGFIQLSKSIRLELKLVHVIEFGGIAEYPATPDNFIYMCRNAL